MKEILLRILNKKNNEVVLPVSKEEILKFENSNNIKLPKEYTELLQLFDGGEILIPGPTVFGLNDNSIRKTIKQVNRKSFRDDYNIPKNYLIIGKTNYGDFICINLNHPNEIIQWDHETNEVFCSWKNLSEWLEDNLNAYIKFEEEE